MIAISHQLEEDDLLLHAVADGPHERSCELAGPDVPCTCEVRVAQAALRLLSVKQAWRGSLDGSDGYDCDGRAMVTFRDDGDIEIYIPSGKARPSVSAGSPCTNPPEAYCMNDGTPCPTHPRTSEALLRDPETYERSGEDADAFVEKLQRPNEAETVPKEAHLRMVRMCNENASAVSGARRWLESFADQLSEHAYQELASVLSDAPRPETPSLGPKCPAGNACENKIYLEEYEKVDRLYSAQVRKNAIEECAKAIERAGRESPSNWLASAAVEAAAMLRRMKTPETGSVDLSKETCVICETVNGHEALCPGRSNRG